MGCHGGIGNGCVGYIGRGNIGEVTAAADPIVQRDLLDRVIRSRFQIAQIVAYLNRGHSGGVDEKFQIRRIGCIRTSQRNHWIRDSKFSHPTCCVSVWVCLVRINVLNTRIVRYQNCLWIHPRG